jgi:hypothetical protein
MKCLLEIEIFKKSILDRCFSIGIKEFYSALLKFDFDIELFLDKAYSLDKIRYFNILKIIKDYKLLNFRNNPHFCAIKKYLDVLSKFFNQYYPLLEKEVNTMKSFYNKNQTKNEVDKNEKMTTEKEDIYNKIIENLISQSINQIPDEVKEVVRRTIIKFDKFFIILIELGKDIDINIFKPVNKSYKDMKDKDFILKISIVFLDHIEKIFKSKGIKKIKINFRF